MPDRKFQKVEDGFPLCGCATAFLGICPYVTLSTLSDLPLFGQLTYKE
jgi:hypothetical protein